MAVIHTGLQQGRSVLGFVLFHQLRLPALRPGRCSCFVYEIHNCDLRRDILRTPWSSRPDIVFLLENWKLLIDLPHSKLHMTLGWHVVDFRHYWFWRICYHETWLYRTHIVFRKLLHDAVYYHHYNFSTVDCPVDTGSCCHCHRCSSVALQRVLKQIHVKSKRTKYDPSSSRVSGTSQWYDTYGLSGCVVWHVLPIDTTVR